MIFKNYEYFLAIVKMGSLTKAAEALYLTQPTLSRYLTCLEQKLNVELFDRSHYPLTLTHAGRLYYEYINNIVGTTHTLLANLDEIRSGVRGEFTFGISSWRSGIILPILLPEFNRRYPHIKVNVVEGKSYTFESAMLNKQVDFCSMSVPSNFSMEVTYERVGTEKIYLAGNNSHPLVQKALQQCTDNGCVGRFPAVDLNGQEFIMLKQGQRLSLHAQKFFADANVSFHDVWSTENIDTAVNMVAATQYFTLVPALYKIQKYKSPDIALFEIGDPPLEWEIAVIYPKNVHITYNMRLFIDELKAFYINFGIAVP